jgi:GDPmannose 4,6-dehydratase
MHLMMQQKQPDDYVVGTGETHQGKEWAQLAFECVGLNWEDYVKSDPQFMRPAEVDLLIADASKAREKLGWVPEVSFRQLIEMMVEHDLAAESKLQAANA